jgi:Ca-activated chloride channel family protein
LKEKFFLQASIHLTNVTHIIARNLDESGKCLSLTALEYNRMSDYTAFVAVDSSEKTAGEYGVTVIVPVPVPDGVKYETTIQER